MFSIEEFFADSRNGTLEVNGKKRVPCIIEVNGKKRVPCIIEEICI